MLLKLDKKSFLFFISLERNHLDNIKTGFPTQHCNLLKEKKVNDQIYSYRGRVKKPGLSMF